MTIYLCAVSGKFPENYEIGVRAGVWGVEDKYQRKIADVEPGDLMVFLVGGEYRSVHQIESEPFGDHSLLWPPKDGDAFPHRVRIGRATHVGKVSANVLWTKISFMKDKVRWQGTVQGPNGVFNNRLEESDLELITSQMRVMRERPVADPPPIHLSAPTIPMEFVAEQVQEALADLLTRLDLQAGGAELPPSARRKDDVHSFVATDRANGYLTTVILDQGLDAGKLLLQALRELSGLRQLQPNAKGVRALILSSRPQGGLDRYVQEIPNITVRRLRMRFELDPEPGEETNGNGYRVA